MRLKHFFVFSCFLFQGGSFLLASTAQETFNTANQEIEKGNIDSALVSYHDLVQRGYESPALFYNLGNVYFKKGERGKSVFWFEKAALLNPRDSDIQYNLRLSKAHLKDNSDSILRKVFFTFTVRETGFLMTLFIWLFFILLGSVFLGWIKNEIFKPLSLWFTGIFLFISISWFSVQFFLMNDRQGVILVPPGEVRNGPGLEYAVGFTVPEGTKVSILIKRPQWTQVGLPQQGLKGWIKADEVGEITTEQVL
ncbi:MAG: tetratricopeptide repeat protein [Elusimicrobiota bacterium]